MNSSNSGVRVGRHNSLPLASRFRNNNFDSLRFCFAFIVFLVHSYALAGEPALAAIANSLSSDVAVKSFFVVSGFLIFKSFEESQTTAHFFIKRLRRIYPAYLCVVLMCALLGGVISSLPLQTYIGLGLLRYIAANLVFLNFLGPDLPGVFVNQPLRAVNGALWTLKIEVLFYLLVPSMVWAMRRFGYMLILLLLCAASISYYECMGVLGERTGATFYQELQRQLLGQLAYFLVGASGYYYGPVLARWGWLWMAFAGLMITLQTWLPWWLLEPIVLGALVVGAACLAPSLGNFVKYGDFSYGIYILHFPILQTLIALGFFKVLGAFQALGLATVLVLSLAVLLWKFVEQPWLRRPTRHGLTGFSINQA